MERYKVYFASDFHLGLDAETSSTEREKKIVAWLAAAAADAKEIYLLGDVFDFWWEYRNVVPKGFTRFLGAVAAVTDAGVPVHFFTGNHDLWAKDYLADECGVVMHRRPVTVVHNGKTFHVAHGDGLGTKNAGRRLLSAMFRSSALQKMYSAVHPSTGVWAGRRWSQYAARSKETEFFCGEGNEDLVRYAKSVLLKENVDYFVFGHRHLATGHRLNSGEEILFLGSWKSSCNYGLWDGRRLGLVTLPW